MGLECGRHPVPIDTRFKQFPDVLCLGMHLEDNSGFSKAGVYPIDAVDCSIDGRCSLPCVLSATNGDIQRDGLELSA